MLKNVLRTSFDVIVRAIIRFDKGDEFVNKDVKGLLEKYNIRHETLVPYT